MRKHNLAFIDLETTGLNPDKHEIIEIGCVVAKQVPTGGRGAKLEIIGELELKVKPERLEDAEPEALRINGYNSGDWLFAADLTQAMKALADKTQDAIMVAHNITFDWPFLARAFAKTGVQNRMHFHKIDLLTFAFARLYHDERAQRFGLGALCDLLGIKNEQAHTALSDIRSSVELYQKLLEP